MLLDADAVSDGKRLLFAEQRRSRITLFLGVIPKGMIALGREIDLTLLQLCLLQSENIRVRLVEIVRKSLCHTGSQTVDIP